MKTSILSIGILVLSLSSLTAQENTNEKQRRKGPPTIKQLLKDLDTNEDGKLSLKEVKGPLKKDFKKIDLNEDGFLSKEELAKAPKPKRPERNGKN
ncbi:EF-hand domain-containing protein [Polaribacter sp. M15]